MGLFGRHDRTNGAGPSSAESHTGKMQPPKSGSTVTLIAKTSQVEGEIKGAGDVHIEGKFKGKLDCPATVFVAPGGQVVGEIRSEVITIAGKVKGNVFAVSKIELAPSAEVEGDITSPRVLIREGATFDGQMRMTGGNAGASPTTPERATKNESGGRPAATGTK